MLSFVAHECTPGGLPGVLPSKDQMCTSGGLPGVLSSLVHTCRAFRGAFLSRPGVLPYLLCGQGAHPWKASMCAVF